VTEAWRRTAPTPPIRWASASRAGGHRVNQDAVGGEEAPPLVLRVLADGLGGHARGEEAAALVVEHCCALFQQAPSLRAGAAEALVRRAHESLLQAEGDGDGARGNGMRSTLVLLVTDGVSARWAHVGDSRLYHFRRGRVLQRTRDHSVPELLVKAGDIRDDEIRGHPDRNRLLQSLGQPGPLRITESELVTVEPGDAFLLCSDGWWEGVSGDAMAETLEQASDPQGWLEAMLGLLEARPGGVDPLDNFTATGVWVG